MRLMLSGVKLIVGLAAATFLVYLGLGWGEKLGRVFASGNSIYSDYLDNNWVNWSWGASINFGNPAPTASGGKSIWLSLSPWGALYLHRGSPLDISSFSHLSFAVQAKEANEQFRLLIYDAGGSVAKTLKINSYGGNPSNTSFTVYKVPVGDLGITNIGGIAIQDDLGKYQAPIFVDSVEFINGAPLASTPAPIPSATPAPTATPLPETTRDIVVYNSGLAGGWSNWSWGGWADLGNPLSFTLNSAWGGLYLHSGVGVNTGGLSRLHLVLQPTGSNEKFQVALFDGNSQSLGFKPLSNWGNISAGSWTTFDIPLSDLNAADRVVKGIVIQDAAGAVQPKILVSEIRFTSSTQSQTSSSPAPTIAPAPSGGGVSTATGTYTTGGGKIFANGMAIVLKGVNWFGAETSNLVPHGLWSRGYKEMISQMKNLGFNAVRVPFCPGTLQNQGVSGIDYSKNSDLTGLNSLQVLDKVLGELDNQGMYILLDHHRPDCQAISELWYTGAYSEGSWINDLTTIASRYKNLSHLVGIDLKNEPHGSASWGTGNAATDWNLAAERAGKAVLGANSNVLVFVEGVSQDSTCSSSIPHFWGGNLEPQKCSPISTASIPANKLVLSPHVYGPDVYNQPYFIDSSFPGNMSGIWNTQFGFLKDSGFTLVPGEWGGKYGTGGGNPADKTFQDAFVSYLKSKGICSSFYWSWNPNSGDTGGVLQDDWATPWASKQELLGNLFNNCN